MQRTNADGINTANVTSLPTYDMRTAPAKLSAYKQNFPLEIRKLHPDIKAQAVVDDTTGPLGVPKLEGSGFSGEVLAVNALVLGTTPTDMTLIASGVPAAGEVLVEYDVGTGAVAGLGIPTLTFANAEGVTACDIVMNQAAADFWLYIEQPDAG